MDTLSGFSSGLTRRDLVYFLFKRKRQIAAITASAFLLSVAGAYLLKRPFEASATVYLARQIPAIAATGADSRVVILDRKEVLESEVDLILSRAVAEKVADTLSAEQVEPSPEAPSVYDRLVGPARRRVGEWLRGIGLMDARSDPRELLVADVQSQITATPARNSNFITIAVQADDPEYASRVVNIATQTYLEQRLLLLQRPGLEVFYEEQIGRARKEVQELEARTQRLKEKTGVITVEDQLKLKLAEFSRLQSELNQVRGEAEELRDKADALRTRVSAEPETVTNSQVRQRNPTIAELEKRRLDLAAARTAELSRFTPGSPPIQEIDRTIAQVTEAIARETPTILSTESISGNSVRLSLESDLYRTESEHTAKLARIRALQGQIAAVDAEIRQVDIDATELRRLAIAQENAERITATYVDEREAARIAHRTDTGVTNVQVLNWASPPSTPMYPRRLVIVLGTLLGVFLAVSAAFMGEVFAQTLDRRDDVERGLGLPLLASVPECAAIQRPL